jgi:hypothetical protein
VLIFGGSEARSTSRRLWRLWEIMDESKIGEIVRLIHGIVNEASLGTNDKAPLNPAVRPLAIRDLTELLSHCEGMGLLVPTQYIRDALLFLRGDPSNSETGMLARSAAMIAHTIEIELRGRKFFALRPEDGKLFDDPLIFGPEGSGAFGEATYEMTEAAKCLALHRSTASAFHSIRCLEAGIRALSRCLQISDPTRASDRNWGAMLKALKGKIDERWPGSSMRLTGDGEFFDNAYAALAAMQNPWRNATMHLDQKYTAEEARHIFEVVKGFMSKIANRMDESGRPLV